MRSLSFLSVPIPISLALIIAAAAPALGLRADDVAPTPVFDAGRVAVIRLTITAENWEVLTDRWEEIPNEERPYVEMDFQWDDQRVERAGIRLKGNGSLYASKGNKFPFLVDFNRYVDKQKFQGLKKLSLHNGSVDDSQLREHLSYGAWRDEGVAASQTGWADVFINDEALGLYIVVEHVDDDFIERHFGFDDGDLYKPESPAGTLVWAGDDIADYENVDHEYQKDTDHAAFIAFVDAINHRGVEAFPEHVDIDGVLDHFAGNTALGNYDTYATKAHNYYLCESSPGKFTLLPWDMNLSQAAVIDVFPGGRYTSEPPGERPEWDRRPLLDKLMESDRYRRRYLRRVAAFLEGAGSQEALGARIDEAEDILGDRLDAAAVGELRREIADRVATLSRQVGELLEAAEPPFRRGDANDDGRVDLADAVATLEWLFQSRPAPGCLAAANADGNDRVNLTDPVALLGHLFRGAPPPPPPFTACGRGEEPDYELGCGKSPTACRREGLREGTP